MVWIRLWISCIAFLSVAGGISFGMTRLAGSVRRDGNLLLLQALQKLTLVLYWLPVPFACVCIPRISFGENGINGYTGEFVCSSVSSMTVVFNLLGMIWLAGFVLSVVRSGIKMYRLAKLMKGNVPVQNARYLDIFEACRRQSGVVRVAFCQNDLLHSPVTAGLVRRQIVLPFADYTDTELWMICEHELMHIRNRDLPWRIFALVTTWIHWFNPAVYLLLGDLDCVQEMICDLSISIGNTHYTKKEYAAFLVKLTDQETVNAYTLALTENKNQTVRRIQKMAETKKFMKPGKVMLGLSGTCLAVLTMIPTIAVSAETAKLQEDWMRAEEVVTIAEPQDYSDPSIEEHRHDDGSVVEIDGSQEIEPYSENVDLTRTINANTRYLYQYRSMAEGESMYILATCEDSAVTYSIGIKNKETGDIVSVSGSGTLQYHFKVSESGAYTVFVENNNNFPIKMSGSAVY